MPLACKEIAEHRRHIFQSQTKDAVVVHARRAPNMPLIWCPYSSFICTLGLVASQQEYAPCTCQQAECSSAMYNCWPHSRGARPARIPIPRARQTTQVASKAAFMDQQQGHNIRHLALEAAYAARQKPGHYVDWPRSELREQRQAGARLLALEAAPAGDVEAGDHAVACRHVPHARAHRLHRAHELRAHARTQASTRANLVYPVSICCIVDADASRQWRGESYA